MLSLSSSAKPRRVLIWREVVVQFEVLPDVGPHVVRLPGQLGQERDQLHQLVVRLVHEPGLDRYPVLKLVTECLKSLK